jgi:type IV pilus assembly protein PilW
VNAARAQRGMTLVELTVAMAIGVFLIGGALYVYSQGRNSYRASDSLARLQESARFALDAIEPDIRLARYWGLNAAPARIDTAGIGATCNGVDASWALNLDAAVEAIDDDFDLLGCTSFNDNPRAGSDVLIVRHAEPWQAGVAPALEAGRLQVQSTLAQGRLFNDGIDPGLGAGSSTNNVTIHAYYVSNESSFDPSLPSLRRLTLGPNQEFDDEEVIPGVENLQVQLGVDTDRDGDVDRYVDGDHPLVTPGAPGFAPQGRVIAVRLWMLVGIPADDQAWIDEQSYATDDADRGSIVAGSADYPAGFRRLQVSKTIYLNNEGA